MKSSKTVNVVDVVNAVRSAKTKINALLVLEDKKHKSERMEQTVLSQQMGAILFDNLHDIGLYVEDAYDIIYVQSLNSESDEFIEELTLLEHVLGGN